MAKETWKRSYQGQREVTLKALRPIHTMVRKIEVLVFLEPALNELVEGIKETLGNMPNKGPIKGRQLAEACGILAVLGDIPDAIPPVHEELEPPESPLFQQEQGQEETLPEPEPESIPEIYIPVPLEAARPAEWF